MSLSFSVLIPTKDRPLTLPYAIRSCVSQAHEKLEVIILDNCCDERTREVVESFDDNRIVHARTDQSLSMTANFERGLHLAKGDYIIYIGDDDALMPNALSQLSELIQGNCYPESFIFPHADYGWPGVSAMIPDKSYKENSVYYESLEAITPGFVDPSIILSEFLKAKRTYRKLPAIYHGCASRSALERIFTGDAFLHSRIPDVYAAVALAATLRTIYIADFYLCIAGASIASTGLAFVSAEADNKLSAKIRQSFNNEEPLPLHDAFGAHGFIGSLRLCEHECYLQARDQGLLSDSDLICPVSFADAAIAEALSPHQPNAADILNAWEHLTKSLDAKPAEIIMSMISTAREELLSRVPDQLDVSIGHTALSKAHFALNPIPASLFGVNDVLGASSLLALLCYMRKCSAVMERRHLEQIEAITGSSSWKLTSPLRRFVAKFNSLRS